MYRYIAYLFTFCALGTAAGVIHLAYLYETVGHGLHPAISAFLCLLLACSVIVMLWVAPELDEPEDSDSDWCYDLTNEVYK